MEPFWRQRKRPRNSGLTFSPIQTGEMIKVIPNPIAIWKLALFHTNTFLLTIYQSTGKKYLPGIWSLASDLYANSYGSENGANDNGMFPSDKLHQLA